MDTHSVAWYFSSLNDVWSLQINSALLTRALIVNNFTCSGWFDAKCVYWLVWVGFLYTFFINSLFPFKLMTQSRNGKFPSDAFSMVNSHQHHLTFAMSLQNVIAFAS